ncbi:hypothetical protein [Lactococcus garvieae]|uniref:Uncharacterized protein n=1 Tax=Lactococcus garvieae DCC43 TaxID=1231377 RepID=K2PKC7_9LACT|nr:hypothetical protein [Lactococcus garvieae]EKF50634.1 hypothetical protein C426_1986 [Lactococcus garvieae DCC43]
MEQTDTIPGRTSIYCILMFVVIAFVPVWMPLLCLGILLKNAKEFIKKL